MHTASFTDFLNYRHHRCKSSVVLFMHYSEFAIFKMASRKQIYPHYIDGWIKIHWSRIEATIS